MQEWIRQTVTDETYSWRSNTKLDEAMAVASHERTPTIEFWSEGDVES